MMKTVTSVSGGKTSAYMALHYPTDYYVFAVVLTDHQPSAPKDAGLLRECQNRIPHFVATHEADQTLVNVLRLEQELGKPIQWVAAEYTLDQFIAKKTDLPGYRSTSYSYLPNKRHRFCTIEQKIMPIFWHMWRFWCDGYPMLMNIGFRWDESKRVENWSCDNNKIRMSSSCNLATKCCNYTTFEWRVPLFPLYEDRVTHDMVRKFWTNKGWMFPEISNCRFCFHHTAIQLQRQAVLEPENLTWWLEQEKRIGSTFGDRPLSKILDQSILDVFDDNKASCFCTD